MEINKKEGSTISRAPRQIPIEIVNDDKPGSSMKILSMPSSSAATKVVDFRQITMKSDFNQALLGGLSKDGKGKQEGRVITKDMIVHAKEMFSLKKEVQGLRPLLPKPSLISSFNNDMVVGEGASSVPMRIKQVSRVGAGGDKVNVIEIVPRESHTGELEVTPSTSKTSMASSAGSSRGRRKYSKRSYYAYVTESESEGEDGVVRKKKVTKRKVVEEVVSGRRSKQASMSQKLAQWGLLPSGKEEEEELMDDLDVGEEGLLVGRVPVIRTAVAPEEAVKAEKLLEKMADEEEDEDFDEEEEDDEEDDDEPLIAAPLPTFINVPLSQQNLPPPMLAPVAPLQISVPPVVLAAASVAPPFITPPKPSMPIRVPMPTLKPALPSMKVAVEKEINSVLDLEDLLSNIERSKAAAVKPVLPTKPTIQATTPIFVPKMPVLPLAARTPLSGIINKTPQMVSSGAQSSNTSTGGALKTITPSGWLKKASSMLVHNRNTPAYKRMDTMNKSLMCKPIMLTKGTIFNLMRIHKATQTEEEEVVEKKSMVLPVPIPFYIPAPTTPCLLPSIHPLPIPIPLTTPCVVPASRASVSKLIEQMQKQLSGEESERVMCPMEADLLQIAELVSSTKTDEDRQLEEYNASIIRGVNDSNYVYPNATPPSNRKPYNKEDNYNWLNRSTNPSLHDDAKAFLNTPNVPGYMDSSRSEEGMPMDKMVPQESRPAKPNQPLPLNDDCMKLKYSYALHTWKYWTELKNSDNSKRAGVHGRVQFFFQADPLKSSAEQLSGSLAYFVRDIRKLDGSKFAPDSIFFLCLGMQYYLRENSREDSIFSDVIYQKFTDALNEVLSTFEMKINPQNMLICRVTEEHLWEAAQLGCHSPQSLLNTLVYFNIKHFLVTSVDDHLKMTANSFEVGSENKDGRLIKKLSFTNSGVQSVVSENLEDPLKCPLRMHQFYLSKCPETQKSFYYLPDFPSKIETHHWYSQNPLSKGALTKIINRCLVVREVQVANLQHMQIEG